MLRSTFVLVLFTVALAAPSCRCNEQREFKKEVLIAGKSQTPYAIATITSVDRPDDPNKLVTYTMRTEWCSGTVKATTSGSAARCGVNLTKNKVYVLRLNKDGTSTPISSCDVFHAYDELSVEHTRFVRKKIAARCEPVLNSPCVRLKCSQGYVCRNAKCSARKCSKICSGGKCRTAGCHFGWKCDGKFCVKKKTTCTTRCNKNYVCTTLGCPSGHTCLLEKCYKNKS